MVTDTSSSAAARSFGTVETGFRLCLELGATRFEHLAAFFRGTHGLALRNEEVAAITVLDPNLVTEVAEIPRSSRMTCIVLSGSGDQPWLSAYGSSAR